MIILDKIRAALFVLRSAETSLNAMDLEACENQLLDLEWLLFSIVGDKDIKLTPKIEEILNKIGGEL